MRTSRWNAVARCRNTIRVRKPWRWLLFQTLNSTRWRNEGQRGTSRNHLNEYLIEFLWRRHVKNSGGDIFTEALKAIATVSPPMSPIPTISVSAAIVVPSHRLTTAVPPSTRITRVMMSGCPSANVHQHSVPRHRVSAFQLWCTPLGDVPESHPTSPN